MLCSRRDQCQNKVLTAQSSIVVEANSLKESDTPINESSVHVVWLHGLTVSLHNRN